MRLSGSYVCIKNIITNLNFYTSVFSHIRKTIFKESLGIMLKLNRIAVKTLYHLKKSFNVFEESKAALGGSGTGEQRLL
jgi:hypothetical protein